MAETKHSTLSVGLVSPFWPPGGNRSSGIVSYVGSLLDGLRQHGADVKVVTGAVTGEVDSADVYRVLGPGEGCHWALEAFVRGATRLAHFGCDTRLRAASLLKGIGEIRSQASLDLLEMEETFGVAGFVASRSPVPIIVRLHGPWLVVGAELGHPADSAFRDRVRAEGRAVVSAAGVSAPSEDVLRRVRSYYGIDLPQAEVIPNPITPVQPEDHWALGRCDKHALLFVGRFDRVKGGDTVIQAFARVAQQDPACRLVFAGPDRGLRNGDTRSRSLNEFLEQEIPDAGIRARVHILGARSASEVAALRSQCLASVVCSRYENFPMAGLEAMAGGCPLIASDVGGLAEMVQHERNGLLCRPGDPEDLAAKMATLLMNPELAARLGRQAASDAEDRYHPLAVAEKTMAFYQRVIERFKARNPMRRRWGWGLP